MSLQFFMGNERIPSTKAQKFNISLRSIKTNKKPEILNIRKLEWSVIDIEII